VIIIINKIKLAKIDNQLKIQEKIKSFIFNFYKKTPLF